jgi:hypothetical protein
MKEVEQINIILKKNGGGADQHRIKKKNGGGK